MSIRPPRHRIAVGLASVLGAAAVALAPMASAASLFHQDCVERPQLFHPQAAWGEFFESGGREGCRVYDANGVLLRTVYDLSPWQPKRVERVPLAPRA